MRFCKHLVANSPALFALVVSFAPCKSEISKPYTATIPTTVLWFEGVAAGPFNQFLSLGDKCRVYGFYIAKPHIELFYIIIK